MDKLGRRLREAREAKGSTLEEAEAATRIRAHFLESLEAGDFAAFGGGDVQVRGFLRIYARYLELSPEDVLGRYSAEVGGTEFSPGELGQDQAISGPPDATEDLTSIKFHPRDIPVGSSLPRWMSVKTVIIVGLLLTTLLVILALVTYLMNRPENEQLLAPLAGTTPTQIAYAPAATSPVDQPTPTFAVSTNGRITLSLEAAEHVQVRVIIDGEVVFQEMMVSGQVETWTDDNWIQVETGNGAALKVTVNGTALGRMGERGQLSSRAWGPDGEMAPP